MRERLRGVLNGSILFKSGFKGDKANSLIVYLYANVSRTEPKFVYFSTCVSLNIYLK